MRERTGSAGQVLALVDAPDEHDVDEVPLAAGEASQEAIADDKPTEEGDEDATRTGGGTSTSFGRRLLKILSRPAEPDDDTEPEPAAAASGKTSPETSAKTSASKGSRPSRASSTSLSEVLLETRPASVAEVVAYTRDGEWVPGEMHPALETAGRIYGYGVAVPVTCAAYALAWLVQRPTRLLIALVLGGLLLASLIF